MTKSACPLCALNLFSVSLNTASPKPNCLGILPALPWMGILFGNFRLQPAPLSYGVIAPSGVITGICPLWHEAFPPPQPSITHHSPALEGQLAPAAVRFMGQGWACEYMNTKGSQKFRCLRKDRTREKGNPREDRASWMWKMKKRRAETQSPKTKLEAIEGWTFFHLREILKIHSSAQINRFRPTLWQSLKSGF